MTPDPFEPFLAARGFVVLDGGLATTLEARGHDLDERLWSAALLRDDPGAIGDVHGAFLEAGADCIITASYQASFPGFAAAGLDDGVAAGLLRRSCDLALEARDAWVAGGRSSGPPPIVAASVGPWGAYLADGSEYDGRYHVSTEELDRFHRRRYGLLADTGVDLMACETIPSREEGEVLLDIVADHAPTPAWMSFACRDGAHLHDGTPFEEVVALCSEREGVVAIGVNCTAPEHVAELVARARSTTDRPLLAYANSGERYDAATGAWWAGAGGRSGEEDWLAGTLDARVAGAAILGGCCRIGPDAIAELRRRLQARD